MSTEIQAWYEDYKQKLQKLQSEAVSEALKEGRREGERKLLLRQLRARFGELPADVVTRIEAAGEADLERWGERVLGAQVLADVLDTPS